MGSLTQIVGREAREKKKKDKRKEKIFVNYYDSLRI